MKRITKVALAAIIAFAPLAAGAITLIPACATGEGNCGVTDILAVFINLAEFLLGIVGAVALGYFVYGGFVFILSRGNKGEVDKAFGILRSAVIGIFIIFLSGVFVRFTTQALTGGTSAIPTVGESCFYASEYNQKSVLAKDANGLWVSIPAGTDADGKPIPEGIKCVKKDDCVSLNQTLNDRNRADLAKYKCIPVSSASSCVRGLCNQPGDFACCLQ